MNDPIVNMPSQDTIVKGFHHLENHS